MDVEPDVAAIASLLGDPSRAAMLMQLLGGKALPATELARAAGISRQTASAHLAKLEASGLVVCERHGRHKYFSLAGNEVAQALEALHAIAPSRPVRSLRESTYAQRLRQARTCYDHLAGRLGVALTDRLIELGLIEPNGADYLLTDLGRRRFQRLGVELEPKPGSRRRFARQCLDWSERRHHLAGSLGAALAARFFELGWVERVPGGRSIRLTPVGTRGLFEEFGLEMPRTG